MFLSLPRISGSGRALIVLENQEEKKKKHNMVLRGILCTLPSLKAFAQAKEFINAVFVLKWRSLETSAEMEGWADAAAQQQNEQRSSAGWMLKL